MDIPRARRNSKLMDLTPLIDVVFLLLIFFMLSTSFVVSESMELTIPADGAAAATVDDVWVLQVKANGEIADDADALTASQFKSRLQGKLSRDANQKILVLAAEKTNVQQLVAVLDAIYVAGGRQVQVDKASAANQEAQ